MASVTRPGKSFSLWFQTTGNGVLLSETASPTGTTTSGGYVNILYVGAAPWHTCSV